MSGKGTLILLLGIAKEFNAALQINPQLKGSANLRAQALKSAK
jgi:hypothetical protein